MKALSYAKNGEPWDVITLQELSRPALTTGTVHVALEAAPIHLADLIAIRGKLSFIPAGPGIPGFEGVGRVIDCADDVTLWKVGDRVILPMAYGAWRQVSAVASEDLLRAPNNVAAEQLALVRINLTTAYLLLNAYQQLAAGDWIVQNSANSNVAYYVAEIARSMQVNVIDVVRRPELVSQLQDSGRTHVLLDTPDLPDQIANITQDRPQLALDAVGGAATARLGNCVANNALVLSYGFLSRDPHRLDYSDLIDRNVRLEGMMTDRAIERLGENGKGLISEALGRLLAECELHAPIAAIYPFSEAAAALRHAAETGEGRHGKVILVP